MNWFAKLWSLFKSYFLPCAQTATDAAEDAGVITPETANEIKEVLEGADALDKIISRSLELIGGSLPENSLLPVETEEDVEQAPIQSNGEPSVLPTDGLQLNTISSTVSTPDTHQQLEQSPGVEPDPELLHQS